MNNSTHTGQRKGRPTIGFFNNEIGRDWALWPWLGMVDTARKHDVNLVTFIGKNMRWATDFAAQANVLYALANGERLDGLIIWKAGLVMSLTEPEVEEFCKRYGVPVVTLEGAVRELPCVTYGNYQGMRAAVDHLIEVHGYRRIGFVGMHEHHIGFQERYRAYTDALTAHGLPVEAKLTRPWFPDEVLLPPAGLVDEQVLSSWLKGALTAGVEAIVGVCDTTTIQILNTLQALGVSVPGEIALVSFDDFTGSRVITPPLTTVMPSWYELGQSAVETLVGILEGKPAPEQVAVTPRLMVRQSCGCLDPAVAQAAAGPVKRVAQAKAWETAFNRGEVATEMVQAARADAVEGIHQEVERLVESFMAEVTGEGAGGFLRELDGVLRRVSANGGNVAGWQNAFSVLRRQVLPWLGEGEVAARAEDLWQQARVVIGERTERALAYRQLLAEQHANQLREVGQTLNTTFDVGELMDELAENLPHLGIPGCYLSLYEEPRPYKYPDPAPEWSHLVLAYNERGRVKLEPGGRRFHSRQWVPEGMLPQDRCYSFVVEPLYFRESQIGFVLFEVGPREGGVYEVLRREISSALQGILLTQQVQHRALQLQTAAEVSSAASSILDLDKLLQQVVNLIHERFNLYYVGLFLVDETQRYAVLCAGTGEAGRQTLEAGHKLEVGSASPIGWCIAHGQARIASDVGAEAVRLKNPLLPATRSEMALPLVARGQTIGAMTIQSDQPAAFAQEDVTILQSMADQMANAIANVQLFEVSRRQAERERLIGEATAHMRETLDVEMVLRTALDEMYRALGLDEIVIRLATQETSSTPLTSGQE
jgi:DNA-binding LacI/PurR family transcriptional regulator/putative methionine-R-sulfoxide reductase with GAF domain